MNMPAFLTAGTNAAEGITEAADKVAEAVKEVSRFWKWWEGFYPSAINFLIKLVIAYVIYIIGKRIIRSVLGITKRAMEKANGEAGVVTFVQSLLKTLLYCMLIILIATYIGIPGSTFVALVGSVGVTIGLALQGSLSNFAGGVLILLVKPFRVGDYIITGTFEGTVTEIDIFYTKMLTIDNRLVVLPNGALSNSNITNVTNEVVRRLDLVIPIGYNDDIRTVKSLLTDLAMKNDMVLKEDHKIDVFVGNFGDDAVEISLRVWVSKDNFFVCRAELLEAIKYCFDENGITIPFHQLDVMVKKEA
ncbi:MAG: mechanosensitive ion channel [Lachnospiraceae bacterium]|nr:mechanosensitive ion channel [Lachnospiraceae bacterium]